jgi:hypothetical protein
MAAEGVERYIGIATPSLRDPRDTPSLLGSIVPIMGRTLLPRAYRELLIWRSVCQVSSVECSPRCRCSGVGEAGCLGGEASGEVLDVGQSHMRGLATPWRGFRRWLTRV